MIGWFNGPLRQYFSLYRAVSQREGEGGERTEESKNVQTITTRTYCKRNRPFPYCDPNCRTTRHWKFTQHHRTIRPPTSSGRAWSGGAKVLGKLPVPGRPTYLDNSRARAYCACNRCGWGLFGHFFSQLSLLFFLPLSGRRPDID